MTEVMFYLFALLTVGSAVIVVTTRSVIYAAFSLMLTLFGIACFYVMLHADFLAATQVLIYVGGILVLILFGVMMTSGKLDIKLKMERGRVIPGGVVALVILGLLLGVVLRVPWPIQEAEAAGSTTVSIGQHFLGDYLLPFEVVSLVLLIALIGAALISRKEVKEVDES